MKKIFLMGIIAMLFTSCVKSTYKVTYVDTKFPSDTVEVAVNLRERFTFVGEDAHVEMSICNQGTAYSPTYVYYLRVEGGGGLTSGTIHTSTEPISIIDFSYTQPKK